MDQLCKAIALKHREEQDGVSNLLYGVALAMGQLVPANDQAKFNHAIMFLSKLEYHFQDEPEIQRLFLGILLRILQKYQRQLFILPDVYTLFLAAPDLLEDFKLILPESAPSVNLQRAGSQGAMDRYTTRKLQHGLRVIPGGGINTQGICIENGVAFVQVPLDLAGPLQIHGRYQQQTIYAPLATTEPTVAATCSQGCKVFQASGGVHALALSEGMSRTPVFGFSTLKETVEFYESVPYLEPLFQAIANATSRNASLNTLIPRIIGKTVHVKFIFTCGDAAEQDMVTRATNRACQEWIKLAESKDLHIVDFQLEGQLSSDKKLSCGNLQYPRGIEVLAWGTISNEACQTILGCTTEKFHQVFSRCIEEGIRNGQNANAAYVMAAMFTAFGQDAVSALGCGWSRLIATLNSDSQELMLTQYLPSIAVDAVGEGTQHSTQQEALELIGCFGPGKEYAFAETVAACCLAGDTGAVGAMTNIDLVRATQPQQ